MKSKKELLAELFRGVWSSTLNMFLKEIIERLPDLDIDKEEEKATLPISDCVMCGGKAKLMEYPQKDGDIKYQVECTNMECCVVATQHSDGESGAIYAWNRQMSKVVRK